jgi:hypothetical protein
MIFGSWQKHWLLNNFFVLKKVAFHISGTCCIASEYSCGLGTCISAAGYPRMPKSKNYMFPHYFSDCVFMQSVRPPYWPMLKQLLNTLRTGDADLRFYITTVQDGWRVFNMRLFSLHNTIMQYIEPVSEWSCWRMFIETWRHSELTFRHRASSI